MLGQAEASKLRTTINEVSRLESRRRRKAEALREKAKSDDINTVILAEAARLERDYPLQKIEPENFEDLFARRLQRYDIDRATIAEERAEQEKLETRIKDANAAFRSARRGDSSAKEREQALQKLETGYLKYREMLANLDVGRKFYNDLAKIVGKFRDDCRSFAFQRRAEAGTMEK
jgi:programmed cell death 6-interacting protein